ncbi:MAG: MltA domain-containing protein [Pseudomonadota bacterium]|nr:MltA domain-containing protein [Pseudomonadota bacterium]
MLEVFKTEPDQEAIKKVAGHAAAFSAFRASAPALLEGQYATGRLGIDAGLYGDAARDALGLPDMIGETDALEFFERHFCCLSVAPLAGETRETGFVTGYYEPEVEASRVPTETFRHPLYARPSDLVAVDDVTRPAGLDKSFGYARRLSCGLMTDYPDRAAIEAGFLKGRGLEIAYVRDEVEAFFIHVQGSARLRFADGTAIRIGYAAKTGHPFTAIGRLLVKTGALTLAEADMDGIRAYLAAHPERVRPVLDQNRSFIFFAERPIDDPETGPIGAANVPLAPLASIAVDRDLATFGVPYLVAAPELRLDKTPFARLMIAQDTGSAIIGAARGDIFVGSGEAAGRIAGRIRHEAQLTLLAPPALAKRLVP